MYGARLDELYPTRAGTRTPAYLRRDDAGGQALVILDFGEAADDVAGVPAGRWTDVMSGERVGKTVAMERYGVRILVSGPRR